jgi:hypothetical protein
VKPAAVPKVGKAWKNNSHKDSCRVGSAAAGNPGPNRVILLVLVRRTSSNLRSHLGRWPVAALGAAWLGRDGNLAVGVLQLCFRALRTGAA